MISLKVFAGFIFIVGAGVRYWVNRRRFNRRNFSGVEVYKNYEHQTGARFIEQILKLIAWLLMIGGVILYFIIWIGDRGRH